VEERFFARLVFYMVPCLRTRARLWVFACGPICSAGSLVEYSEKLLPALWTGGCIGWTGRVLGGLPRVRLFFLDLREPWRWNGTRSKAR
jgi:hypothetical protein